MIKAQHRLSELHCIRAADWSHLGHMYYDQFKWDESVKYHTRSIHLYPLNPRYRMFLMKSLIKQGETSRACETGLKALEINKLIRDQNVKLTKEEVREIEQYITANSRQGTAENQENFD
jgi:hypothetical protein